MKNLICFLITLRNINMISNWETIKKVELSQSYTILFFYFSLDTIKCEIELVEFLKS